jgi:hypothetical protein
MKIISLIIISFFISSALLAQDNKESSISIPDPAKKTESVKAACGQCMFGMSGKDCTLAVKIKNKTYYVEGTGIDDHGDAHAKDGFCNKVRKADIQGELVDDKYRVTYFKLTDIATKKTD